MNRYKELFNDAITTVKTGATQTDLMSSLAKVQNILNQPDAFLGQQVDRLSAQAKQKSIEYLKKAIDELSTLAVMIAKQKAIVEAKIKLLEEKEDTLIELSNLCEDEGHTDYEDRLLQVKLKELQKLEDKLDTAYIAAMKALEQIRTFLLKEQSLNLFMTPKSVIHVQPTKMVNMVPRTTGQVYSFNPELLNPVIKAICVASDIPEPAFALEPEVFEPLANVYFSVSRKINKIINYIKPWLKYTEEPLPSYNDLRFDNPNFILWSVTQFGPFGAKFFGLP